MATRLTHETRYDAPLEEVLSMLGDPAFREEVCEAQSALRYEVEITGGDVEWEARVERVMPAGDLPSFARSVIGEEITVVQTESWRGAEAEVAIAIPGKPGEGSGTASLTEAGGHTAQRVDLAVKVSLPLVGGKLERLVAGFIEKALDKEHEVGVGYLSR